MRLGVLANVYRPGFEQAFATLNEWSGEGGHTVTYEASLSDYCRDTALSASPDAVAESADIVLALGGDGTMLRAARIVGRLEKPILGVNLGSLGFLTQITPPELAAVLRRLAAGDYLTEARTVLAFEGPDGGSERFAVNEVTIDRGPQTRAIELRLEANRRLVCRYVADGVIVATPTGSTAYALSAGGPVALPDLRAILVTPVAPHTLAQRPVIFPDDVELCVTSEEPHVTAAVTLDGQNALRLAQGESCRIRRADFHIHLVRFAEQDFFSLVRTKLHWGVDPRHAHRDGRVV